MSGPTVVTPLATYRNERPYPFCPGCGHGPILDRLNEALVRRGRDPRQVVIVSDKMTPRALHPRCASWHRP